MLGESPVHPYDEREAPECPSDYKVHKAITDS